MKNKAMRFGAVFAAALCGVGNTALAHDVIVPCWRSAPGSTFQDWTFSTNLATANPEVSENPYGTAQAVVAVGPFASGWLWNANLGTNHGYWDLGRNGTITLTIPNRTTALPSYKYVWVQVTEWYDGGIYGQVPAVSIPGAVQLGTATIVDIEVVYTPPPPPVMVTVGEV